MAALVSSGAAVAPQWVVAAECAWPPRPGCAPVAAERLWLVAVTTEAAVAITGTMVAVASGPGAVVGGVIGGALASQSYGYGPGYYDDQYYDDGAVAVDAAPGGDDAVAYCTQTYRSYDPRSGTYLGNDGYRHPCP